MSGKMECLRRSSPFPWPDGWSVTGAGDLYERLDHVVEKLGFLCLRRFIVDFFPLPAAYDQPGCLQLLQVVGYGGTAHLHHGRDIDYTFLTVAQQPENPETARVPQLFENLGGSLKLAGTGHMVQLMLHGLAVIVGQLFRHHSKPPSYSFY